MVLLMDNLLELCSLLGTGGQLPLSFQSQTKTCEICGALVHCPYFN